MHCPKLRPDRVRPLPEFDLMIALAAHSASERATEVFVVLQKQQCPREIPTRSPPEISDRALAHIDTVDLGEHRPASLRINLRCRGKEPPHYGLRLTPQLRQVALAKRRRRGDDVASKSELAC